MPHPAVASSTPPQRLPVSSLYVAKAFAALLVVIGHIPLGTFKDWIYPLTLSAVPIFFLISGYFLYTPNEEEVARRAWRSIKKITPILLGLTCFYWIILLPNMALPRLWAADDCTPMVPNGYAPSTGNLYAPFPMALREIPWAPYSTDANRTDLGQIFFPSQRI